MTTLAALGWSLFVIAVGVSILERRYSKTLLAQKDNAIALWRSENGRIWGKLADSEQILALREHEIERLTPKHGKDGKFARKRK